MLSFSPYQLFWEKGCSFVCLPRCPHCHFERILLSIGFVPCCHLVSRYDSGVGGLQRHQQGLVEMRVWYPTCPQQFQTPCSRLWLVPLWDSLISWHSSAAVLPNTAGTMVTERKDPSYSVFPHSWLLTPLSLEFLRSLPRLSPNFTFP